MSDNPHPKDSLSAAPSSASESPAEQPALLPSSKSGSTSGDLLVAEPKLPSNLLILPTHSPIIFPTLLAPVLVTQPALIALIDEAVNRQRILGLLLTREGAAREQMKSSELFQVGVAVKVIKRLKLPDGTIHLLVQSLRRFRCKTVVSEQPYLVMEAEYLEDIIDPARERETDAFTRAIVSAVKKLSDSNPFFTEEVRLALINAPGPSTVADLVAFALGLPRAEAQDYLETLPVLERFEKLLIHLKKEQELVDLQKKIQEDVHNKLGKMQKEYFLKEQLRSIKRELGTDSDPKEKGLQSLKERLEAAQLPPEAKKVAFEELERFESLSESSPEHQVARNYLELLATLPWNQKTQDRLNLQEAEDLLNREHFGLKKVKERILEFLAIRKLKPGIKGSILCLVGPPGVGKTSLGRSIAQTLGRQFFRFSLGGMRDEAEIKGHRRTYVGAMPGKILQGLKRAGSKNPVLLLDEIDKLSHGHQGDPASALLEVLDPEQNVTFLDHYLDIPFDLSDVLFITTANTTASIPAPLLDRMELIELSGYTLEDKEAIAQKILIPKTLQEHGLTSRHLRFEKTALRQLMLDYAREPGLRSLQKWLQQVARKTATQLIRHQDQQSTSEVKRPPFTTRVVRAASLEEWLGPKRFFNEVAARSSAPGVVVGLAWTALGGEILFIEAIEMPGSGQLKLTGQMGAVMSESASIAWSYVKKRILQSGLKDRLALKKTDIHLHIPAGAIPKDGPSAGITMATALTSLLLGKRVQSKLAMTGELSLVGKVLPVGGIQEKLLAAKRAGIQTILLPALNKKDLAEIQPEALKGLTLHWVSHMEEVLELALEGPARRVLKTGSPSSLTSPAQPPGKKRSPAGSSQPTIRRATKRLKRQPVPSPSATA
jgi:ATP-dependent Lon protease